MTHTHPEPEETDQGVLQDIEHQRTPGLQFGHHRSFSSRQRYRYHGGFPARHPPYPRPAGKDGRGTREGSSAGLIDLLTRQAVGKSRNWYPEKEYPCIHGESVWCVTMRICTVFPLPPYHSYIRNTNSSFKACRTPPGYWISCAA